MKNKLLIFAIAFILLIGLAAAGITITKSILINNIDPQESTTLLNSGYDGSTYHIDHCERANQATTIKKCIIVVDQDGHNLDVYDYVELNKSKSSLTFEEKIQLKVNLYLQEKAKEIQREQSKVIDNETQYTGTILISKTDTIDAGGGGLTP